MWSEFWVISNSSFTIGVNNFHQAYYEVDMTQIVYSVKTESLRGNCQIMSSQFSLVVILLVKQ